MAKTINITAVYGVKDDGELVNIVVEGNSDEIPYVLLTIWGKKLHRNIIRQISSGEFNESIEQDIIESTQCACGDPITIKAFCLANSAISDTWIGELQCLEIGQDPAVTDIEDHEVEETEVEEKKAVLPEPLPLEVPTFEKEEAAAETVTEGLEVEEAGEVGVIEEEIPAPEKEEPAVTVAEALEEEKLEEAQEVAEVKEVEEVEEETVDLPQPLPLELPALEIEEEPAVIIAEGLEAEETEGVPVPEKEKEPTVSVAEGLEEEKPEEAQEVGEVQEVEEEKVSPPESLPGLRLPKFFLKRLFLRKKRNRQAEESAEAKEAEEEKAALPEPLPLETPTLEKEEEAAETITEGLEVEEAGEVGVVEEEIPAPEKEEPAVTVAEALEEEKPEEAQEVGEVKEVEEVEEKTVDLPEPLPLEIPTLEKEEEAAETIAEGLEVEEAGEVGVIEEEIPAPEKEEEPAVIVAEALEEEKPEEAQEVAEVKEVEEVEEETVDLPEPLPLEAPTFEKEEAAAETVTEGLEVKEEKESVPKSFLFPTIEITTVKSFTYHGKLVDIVVEGTSFGGKRILIKIQSGNIKFYKIISPSFSGEFKASFEQDIGRSTQSSGGDQTTVTALSLANSSIYDIWQGKLPSVEK